MQIPVEKVVERERVVEKLVPVPGPERVVVKEARERQVYTEPVYRNLQPEQRYAAQERTTQPPPSPPSPPRSRTAVGIGLSLYRRENVSVMFIASVGGVLERSGGVAARGPEIDVSAVLSLMTLTRAAQKPATLVV